MVVVGADHVYRMDFQQMVAQHVASGAKATVAAVRQPLEMANQFGVIEVDQEDASKISAFVEKPASTPGLAAAPDQFLASMGNYVFDADALVEALTLDAERTDTKHDMGGDIIPYFVSRGEAGVYDFTTNSIPGATERDRTYWRDVGTIDSFYDAHMDLISPVPVFNLYNRDWPIFTRQTISPPAKFVKGRNNTVGTALDSIVANGVVVSGGIVEGSVLSNDAYIEAGARVLDSVLMDNVYVGEGAIVRRAILDKNVRVPKGATIGLVQFPVDESGNTVLSKGQPVPEPDEDELALSRSLRGTVPESVKAAVEEYDELKAAIDKVSLVQTETTETTSDEDADSAEDAAAEVTVNAKGS